jgi:hypothetical protein
LGNPLLLCPVDYKRGSIEISFARGLKSLEAISDPVIMKRNLTTSPKITPRKSKTKAYRKIYVLGLD